MTSHDVLVLALAAMLVTITSADLEKRSITDDSVKMTSRTILMFALAAMLIIMTSADLEVPSVSADLGAGGQWPVTGGQLQKWLFDSLSKKEELLVKKDEILIAKEKELCELRSKVKQLETKCDVTDTQGEKDNLKNGLTSQGREMTKLRCEQTEREIRGLQADHEALTNRSLQLQTEILNCKFHSNELNVNNWHLKQNIEGCKKELKFYKDSNSSESLQVSSRQHEEEVKEFKQQMSHLTALVENLNISMPSQIKQQQCTSKIAELGMLKFENKYYHFSEQTYKKTWHEAFWFCKSHGLDLVTINSTEENNFITAHLVQRYGSGWNAYYWLGGNDLSTSGKWVWSSTGQPLTFNSWGSGEPNNEGNCLLTHNHANHQRLWYDYPCTQNLPFICDIKDTCN